MRHLRLLILAMRLRTVRKQSLDNLVRSLRSLRVLYLRPSKAFLITWSTETVRGGYKEQLSLTSLVSA